MMVRFDRIAIAAVVALSPVAASADQKIDAKLLKTLTIDDDGYVVDSKKITDLNNIVFKDGRVEWVAMTAEGQYDCRILIADIKKKHATCSFNDVTQGQFI